MLFAARSFPSLQATRNWVCWAIVLLLGCQLLFADQSVTLTWSPSPDTNAVGYDIYYGGASGDYTNTVAVGNTTTVTVSGLSDGATYYFSATTVSASGQESAFSNEAVYVIPQATNSFTTTNSTLPPPADPSPVPAFDTITNITIYANSGVQTVPLTGVSAGSSDPTLTVTIWAYTSDATIIPAPTVNYASPNSTGTLTFAPVANALGTATVSVKINNGDNNYSQDFTVTVVPAPIVILPPTLDGITNLSIYQNAGSQTVNLTGISSGSSSGGVIISAVSSDPTILATPIVSYTNQESTGTLTITPVAGAVGTATITVTVDNGAPSDNVVTQTFAVTVLPSVVATPVPTLAAISNVTLYKNAGAQTISLAGISPGSTNGNLVVTIWAYTSDATILPAPTVNYSNPNSGGTLTFAPVTNALGTATITVKINNGVNNFTQTFTVTVITPPVVVPPPSSRPTLDPIPNVTLSQGTLSETIMLTGLSSSSLSKSQPIRISAASSNPRLIATPVIHYTSPSNTAVLTLRPAPLGIGSATITVTVNNGTGSNNIIHQAFVVAVAPTPTPTLDPVANLTVAENAGVQQIALTGIASGSAASPALRISAASNDPRVLANPTIQYTSPANSAILSLRPSGRFTGTAKVTVTVSDGSRYNSSVQQTFVVTVTAPPNQGVTPTAISASLATETVIEATNTMATLTAISKGNGWFSFQVAGVTAGKYVVQATTDLAHWTSIETNVAPFVFQESMSGVDRRFYRAVYQQ